MSTSTSMPAAPTINMPPPAQDLSSPGDNQPAGPTAQSTMASLGQPKTSFDYQMRGGTMNTLAQGAQQLAEKAKQNKGMLELFSHGEGVANETIKSAIQECGPDIQSTFPPKSVSIKNGKFDPLDYSMRIYTSVLEWRKEHGDSQTRNFLKQHANDSPEDLQAAAQASGISHPSVDKAITQKLAAKKEAGLNNRSAASNKTKLDIAAAGRKIEGFRLSIEQSKGQKSQLEGVVKALQSELDENDKNIAKLQSQAKDPMTDPNDVAGIKRDIQDYKDNGDSLNKELKAAKDAWYAAIPGGQKLAQPPATPTVPTHAGNNTPAPTITPQDTGKLPPVAIPTNTRPSLDGIFGQQ